MCALRILWSLVILMLRSNVAPYVYRRQLAIIDQCTHHQTRRSRLALSASLLLSIPQHAALPADLSDTSATCVYTCARARALCLSMAPCATAAYMYYRAQSCTQLLASTTTQHPQSASAERRWLVCGIGSRLFSRSQAASKHYASSTR